MEHNYILAIDQGTSSTKTIVFNAQGQVVAKATEPLKTFYTKGGFVEQDPEEIYANVLASVKSCLTVFEQNGGSLQSIKTCGIANQRETFVVWDEFGQPLYNAVVWQCKRSVEICGQLKADGLEPMVRERTGLIIDPYFSATKLIWLYRNDENVRRAVDEGRAHFGTVDTWLLFKLSNGQHYLTDHTNASRTLFFNLETLNWDAGILQSFGLSKLKLPLIKASAADYGASTFGGQFKQPLSISAMIGDSHAAAFGEGCFKPGKAKATLGTGCSILMNIGAKPTTSGNGMMTTVCWSTGERVDYALEGVIVSCGATIEWLKNELGLFKQSSKTEQMAASVPNSNGVFLIPAFSGLGAPHWDMNRKAEIKGLTFDCNKNHIVRAALESIAFQIKDVVAAMEQDAGIRPDELMVNGGMTINRLVLQSIADVLNCNLVKGDMPDVSALGAGLLAGLKAGIFKSIRDIEALKANPVVIKPQQDTAAIQACYTEWLTHVKQPARV